MKRDLLSILDLSNEEVIEIFYLAKKLKAEAKKKIFKKHLKDKTFILIFKKPSNRTLVSFQVGIAQLGGASFNIFPSIGVGERESVKDVALTLSRYADAIIMRTFGHEEIKELANFAAIPVINALTDFEHPCQALADFFTIWEKRGNFGGLNFAFVGDSNNVCNSLIFLASKLGVKMKIASPKNYQPPEEVLRLANSANFSIEITEKPEAAVREADIIYTDVWTSMGEEDEKEKRDRDFAGFQINLELEALAKKDHLLMHCLPAHRGEEITDEVIDGANSIVFDQAENRLHVQKAILVKLLK